MVAYKKISPRENEADLKEKLKEGTFPSPET